MLRTPKNATKRIKQPKKRRKTLTEKTSDKTNQEKIAIL